jgi:predicted PurR-regulated permease PerM
MERNRWFRTLVILLVIIAGLYLAGQVWEFIGRFGDIILLFALAWLVAFIFRPIVDWLDGHPAPRFLGWFVRRTLGERPAAILEGVRFSRGLAVTAVYFGLVILIVIFAILLIPVTVDQLSQLSAALPYYLSRMPDLVDATNRELAHFGVKVDFTSIYEPDNLNRQVQSLAGEIIRNAGAIAAGVANTVTYITLLLVLSFYISLEGKGVTQRALELVPQQYKDDVLLAMQAADRNFGGFVRSSLLLSFLYTLGVIVVMNAANLPFVLGIATISGLLTLIPFIGPPISLALPALIALFQDSNTALWVFIVLAVYQQIFILQFVVPRVLSEASGMPVLLVLAGMLIGLRLIGFWGLIFGAPLAGVVYTMGVPLLQRLKRRGDARYRQAYQQEEATFEDEGEREEEELVASTGSSQRSPPMDSGYRF